MKIILGIVIAFAAPLLLAQQSTGADDIPDFDGVWLAGGGGAPQGGMGAQAGMGAPGGMGAQGMSSNIPTASPANVKSSVWGGTQTTVPPARNELLTQ